MNSPTNNQITTPKEKTCESCGKIFECGADSGSCWCFSIEITPQDLAKLKEQFQNCLCQECLRKPFIPENSNTQGK